MSVYSLIKESKPIQSKIGVSELSNERRFGSTLLNYAEQREIEVSIDLGAIRDPFIHVHVCVHCGGVSRREEFEDRAQTTGIYLCSKCGKEGPLNIEIRATDTLNGDPSGSSRQW